MFKTLYGLELLSLSDIHLISADAWHHSWPNMETGHIHLCCAMDQNSSGREYFMHILYRLHCLAKHLLKTHLFTEAVSHIMNSLFLCIANYINFLSYC